MAKILIDLSSLGGKVYVGRPNGLMAREHFAVEKYEQNGEFPINVKFPSDARTLTSSFFLGMFGNSVISAGTKEEFLRRFTFTANERIINEINEGISDALMAR